MSYHCLADRKASRHGRNPASLIGKMEIGSDSPGGHKKMRRALSCPPDASPGPQMRSRYGRNPVFLRGMMNLLPGSPGG